MARKFTIFDAMCRLSVAAIATICVGIVLLLVAITAWIVYSLDASRVAWGNYMSLGQAAAMIVLWCGACGLTYGTVRLWMQQPPLNDRQLRDSWTRGIHWLASHGVDITDRPCFVVLGCSSRYWQQQLFAGGQHMPHLAEDADSSLDWVLADDHILLVCRDLGVYGRLIEKLKSKAHLASLSAPDVANTQNSPTSITAGSSLDHQPAGDQDSHDQDSHDQDSHDQDSHDPGEVATKRAAGVGDETSSGDRVLEGESMEERSSGGTSPTKLAARPKTSTGGVAAEPVFESLDRVDALVHQATASFQSYEAKPRERAVTAAVVLLDSTESMHSQLAFSRFCGCLKAARYPVSPINGTLVMIDPAQLHDAATARTLGRAIRSDLNQLQAELGVASPVTTVVLETHHQDDLAELGRRLSMSPSLSQVIARHLDSSQAVLGRIFDPAEVPTRQAMHALVDQSIASISNRIEDILGDPISHSQPANHRLVRLTIRCRAWRDHLQQVFAESFGATEVVDPDDDEPAMVSGLFVAGRGTGVLLRPFIDAAVRHMLGQQHHLQWTRLESASQRRNQSITFGLIAAVCILAVLWLLQVAHLVQRYSWTD